MNIASEKILKKIIYSSLTDFKKTWQDLTFTSFLLLEMRVSFSLWKVKSSDKLWILNLQSCRIILLLNYSGHELLKSIVLFVLTGTDLWFHYYDKWEVRTVMIRSMKRYYASKRYDWVCNNEVDHKTCRWNNNNDKIITTHWVSFWCGMAMKSVKFSPDNL